MKKTKMSIIVLMLFLCILPIIFDIAWKLDIFNQFPLTASKGGRTGVAMAGTVYRFGDGSNKVSVGIGYVRLDRQNEWDTYCDIVISFDENRDDQDVIDMDVIARAGDEFELNGYVIRVLRVFPYSTSLLGYDRGEVTLELIDLNGQNLP